MGIARKLARVVPGALQQFFTDRCPQQAAGIAYRVLFSIVPLAIVLVSVFGLVLQDDSIHEEVVDTIVDAASTSARASVMLFQRVPEHPGSRNAPIFVE